jgi:hypothetical protein
VTGLLRAALYYASRGWSVIPCAPNGKRPLTSKGLHDASLDPERITSWWYRWPQANIGISTGGALDVIDIDSPEGLEALTSAAGLHQLGWGPVARTGRGWHYYLAGAHRRTRIGILDGVDLKAADAYVIAPPSLHHTGRRYHWMFTPEAVNLQPAPPWLEQLLRPPARNPNTAQRTDLVPGSRFERLRYALAALRSEAGTVARASEGGRNVTLNLAAFRMRRFLETGELSEGDVVEELLPAAMNAGLGHVEAVRTIASGLGTGK